MKSNKSKIQINQAMAGAMRTLSRWGGQTKANEIMIDAEILLSNAIGGERDRAWLYGHPEYELTRAEAARFSRYVERRAKGEPVAYITGHKEFYGLDFIVNKNVLVPRPETELMVENVLSRIKNQLTRNKKILLIDVGTGSGCIPINILKNINPNYQLLITNYYAIDISAKALRVARKNAKRYGLKKKIKFVQGNLLEPIFEKFNNGTMKQWSNIIITANLPYLSPRMYQENYQGLKYEPKQALVAGKDGLELYEKLLKQISTLKKLLNCYMVILLEIDPRQASLITKLIKKYLPGAGVEIKKDLAGRKRVVMVSCHPERSPDEFRRLVGTKRDGVEGSPN